MADLIKQAQDWAEVEGAIATNPDYKNEAWQLLDASEKSRIKVLKERDTQAQESKKTVIAPKPSQSFSTPVHQTPAQYRAVEVLTRRDSQWLQGYFYVGRKGDRIQLADRSGFDGIFVDEGEFRFVDRA